VISNGSEFTIDYWVTSEAKVSNQWMNTQPGMVLHNEERKVIAPHSKEWIYVQPPRIQGSRWRIVLRCARVPGSDDSVLSKIGEVFEQYGLRRVAVWFQAETKVLSIRGPELTVEN
jgi:hypothetical protein